MNMTRDKIKRREPVPVLSVGLTILMNSASIPWHIHGRTRYERIRQATEEH
jgi:hypothetical protein